MLGRPPFHDTTLTTSSDLSYIGGNWTRDIAFAGTSIPLTVRRGAAERTPRGHALAGPGAWAWRGTHAPPLACCRARPSGHAPSYAAHHPLPRPQTAQPLQHPPHSPARARAPPTAASRRLPRATPQGDFPASRMIDSVPGVDPARRARLVKVLDIDPSWRMHQVSDGQRRRVQICVGLLRPFKASRGGRAVAPRRGGRPSAAPRRPHTAMRRSPTMPPCWAAWDPRPRNPGGCSWLRSVSAASPPRKPVPTNTQANAPPRPRRTSLPQTRDRAARRRVSSAESHTFEPAAAPRARPAGAAA